VLICDERGQAVQAVFADWDEPDGQTPTPAAAALRLAVPEKVQ
jgi:hypothetical protein